MSAVTIRVIDAGALNGFSRIAERAPEKLQAVIETFVLDAHGEAVQSIRSSRPSGRLYTHRFWTDSAGRLRIGGKRSKPHRASAPGQPPAVDTGNLVGHIEFDSGPGYGEVGATVKTGLWMEEGTRKIQPRPWLMPAISKVEEKLKAAIEKVFDE
jgi:hypothetical protein